MAGLVNCARRLITACTCSANSRVGTTTSACGTALDAFTRDSTPREKAAVYTQTQRGEKGSAVAEPVSALPGRMGTAGRGGCVCCGRTL